MGMLMGGRAREPGRGKKPSFGNRARIESLRTNQQPEEWPNGMSALALSIQVSRTSKYTKCSCVLDWGDFTYVSPPSRKLGVYTAK